jgi:hypothetical protein
MSIALRTFAEMYVNETLKFFVNSIESTRLHINRMFAINNITQIQRDACMQVLNEIEVNR